MVRISDILKKSQGHPEEEPKPSALQKEAQALPPTPPRQIHPSQEDRPLQTSNISPVRLADIMSQKGSSVDTEAQMQIAQAMKEIEPNIERSRKLYAKALNLSRDFLKAVKAGANLEVESISSLVDSLISCFILGDKSIYTLFYEDYPVDDYLSFHMINVMVMSVGVGLEMKYNKSTLSELGLASFLHDVGMVKVEDVVLKPGKLSGNEKEEVRKHPLYGADILSEIKNISKAVISGIKEQHERVNGTGYPQAIKDKEISVYARVIATVDVYEALTHDRVYRKKYPPYEAMKEILNSEENLFDQVVLRVLVNQVGIYPIGSWVELNTGEISRVIFANNEFPLRPVVNIFFDTSKHRLENPRILNLAKQYNIYVKKPLSDREVEIATQGRKK